MAGTCFATFRSRGPDASPREARNSSLYAPNVATAPGRPPRMKNNCTVYCNVLPLSGRSHPGRQPATARCLFRLRWFRSSIVRDDRETEFGQSQAGVSYPCGLNRRTGGTTGPARAKASAPFFFGNTPLSGLYLTEFPAFDVSVRVPLPPYGLARNRDNRPETGTSRMGILPFF